MDIKTYGFVKKQTDTSWFGESQCFRHEKEPFAVMEIPVMAAEELLLMSTEEPQEWKERQKNICQELDCAFLLLIWQEQEEERLLFFSRSKRVRALEFLDYLIGEFGLVKGEGNAANGRISSVILKVQTSGEEMKNTTEYFLNKATSYFEDCDCIDAGIFAEQHFSEIETMKRYMKKQIPWAFVKSTDITGEGKFFFMKSLENESGLTVKASEDTYIMIGCRGEVYDIARRKFESTYEATPQALDVFELMLDFLPAVETVPEGEYISLDEIAHLCYPKKGKGIYACELQKRTKVFPVNQAQEYYLGHPGDYMAVRTDDFQDIYIIQREIFLQSYEEA